MTPMSVAGLCCTGAEGISFHQEPSLVVLSYIVAVVGSYTALEVIERWRNAQGAAAYYWQFFSAAALGSSIAHGRGRPSLHYRSELQRELPPHILHRRLARRESTLQLGIFDCCEHLFEAWTGLISCFDQVAAGN